MENNNQELNNKTNKQNNSILIIVMALIIVALAGYIVYIKFIQKTESVNPKDNNTEEKEKKVEDIVVEYGKQYKITEKVTYKSKDGKNELVIEPNGDDNYYAYFNGKKFEGGVLKLGKYLLVEGFEIGQNSQCGEYTYIINSENKELVDLYTKNLLNIVKVNNNYYFIEDTCGNGNVAIYDEKLNKIGTSYIGSDKKNFYIFDKNIVKYNSNGEVVAKTKDTFDVENNDDSNIMGQEFNNQLYILINDKNNVYFIDTSDLEVIKIGSSNEYAFGGYEAASMDLENNKIVLRLINLKNSNEITNMYYDITSKTLSK